MQKYVVPDLPDVDNKIRADLIFINKSLNAEFGNNLIAIILCGGFGRGEGTFVYEDDRPLPFNDYDLVLVTKTRIPYYMLRLLSEKLAKQINIRFVDIGVIREKKLATLSPTIFNYDLKNSTIIYGDMDILSKIPVLLSENLPLEEARIMLHNRLICFLELTPDGFLNKKPLSPKVHKNLILQLSKAVLAATIAWLVKNKQYTTSYQNQLTNFLTLNQGQMDKELVTLSYQLKLGVTDPLSINPWQYWMDARNFFIKTFEIFEKDKPKQSKFNLMKTIKSVIKYLLYGEPLPNASQRLKAETSSYDAINSVRDDFTSKVTDWDAAKNLAIKLWFRFHH